MSFTIETSVSVAYQVILSDQSARTIANDWRDPDEKWADEAEHCLTTAFEDLVGQIIEAIGVDLPALEFSGTDASVGLFGFEDQAQAGLGAAFVGAHAGAIKDSEPGFVHWANEFLPSFGQVLKFLVPLPPAEMIGFMAQLPSEVAAAPRNPAPFLRDGWQQSYGALVQAIGAVFALAWLAQFGHQWEHCFRKRGSYRDDRRNMDAISATNYSLDEIVSERIQLPSIWEEFIG